MPAYISSGTSQVYFVPLFNRKSIGMSLISDKTKSMLICNLIYRLIVIMEYQMVYCFTTTVQCSNLTLAII